MITMSIEETIRIEFDKFYDNIKSLYKIEIDQPILDELKTLEENCVDNASSDYTTEMEGSYESGYDSGHDNGFDQGHESGRDEGYEEGHDEGYEEGHDVGYKEGLVDGYDDGYSVSESEHSEKEKA